MACGPQGTQYSVRALAFTSTKVQILTHLCAWPFALQLHLRGDRNVRELEEIYAAFDIGPELDSVRRIFRADNMPLVIKALSRHY